MLKDDLVGIGQQPWSTVFLSRIGGKARQNWLPYSLDLSNGIKKPGKPGW
jgi:hypothetical protein